MVLSRWGGAEQPEIWAAKEYHCRGAGCAVADRSLFGGYSLYLLININSGLNARDLSKNPGFNSISNTIKGFIREYWVFYDRSGRFGRV